MELSNPINDRNEENLIKCSSYCHTTKSLLANERPRVTLNRAKIKKVSSSCPLTILEFGYIMVFLLHGQEKQQQKLKVGLIKG